MAFVSSTGRIATSQRCAATAALTADLAWERCQEQAAIAFRAGDTILSSRLWAQALAIARKRFGRGDPRLASSLTNQALVLRRRGQEYQAKMLFREAIDTWEDSWRWVHLMSPCPASVDPRRFDHLEFYGPADRAWFEALARQGRAATVALEHRDERLATGLEEWFAIKPKRLSDLRRLLGAVLLIAPEPRP